MKLINLFDQPSLKGGNLVIHFIVVGIR